MPHLAGLLRGIDPQTTEIICKWFLGHESEKVPRPMYCSAFRNRHTSACQLIDAVICCLLRRLQRAAHAPSTLVRVYRDSHGKKRFQGHVRRLKASQEYPLAFGKEEARLHAEYKVQLSLLSVSFFVLALCSRITTLTNSVASWSPRPSVSLYSVSPFCFVLPSLPSFSVCGSGSLSVCLVISLSPSLSLPLCFA